MWMLHSDFKAVVLQVWNSIETHGCPRFMVVKELQTLKHRLREWNYFVFDNINDQVSQAHQALLDIQMRIASKGPYFTLLDSQIVAKSWVLEVVNMQTIFWRDRARVKCLKDAYKSTKTFHNYARARQARAIISGLFIGDSWCDDL